MCNLRYLKKGKNKKFPSYFESKNTDVKFYQTQSQSTDGTPRYCPNPNSNATYHIKEYLEAKYNSIY